LPLKCSYQYISSQYIYNEYEDNTIYKIYLGDIEKLAQKALIIPSSIKRARNLFRINFFRNLDTNQRHIAIEGARVQENG
jgi:hypothetical protein